VGNVLGNRPYFATATTGTGTVTVGAAVTSSTLGDFITPNQAGLASKRVSYTIHDGNNSEVGTGTFDGTAATMTRDTVDVSVIAGVVGTTKLTLSGSAKVMITGRADDFNRPLLIEAEPAAPSEGVTLFARLLAARRMLSWKQTDTEVYQAQPFFARNNVGLIMPGANSNAITTAGIAATTSGAVARTPASTNLFTSTRRIGLVTAATLGTSAQLVSVSQAYWRGSAAGRGGFFFCARFGNSTASAHTTYNMFVGLLNQQTAMAATTAPSATLAGLHCVGAYVDSAQNTLRLICNNAVAAPPTLDLGANFPFNTLSTDLYELVMYCPPNSTDVWYRVERLSTTIPLAYDDVTRSTYIATGTFNTSLSATGRIPTNTIFMAPQVWVRTNAAQAAGLDLAGLYVEADT
jgi:hypothetical protein